MQSCLIAGTGSWDMCGYRMSTIHMVTHSEFIWTLHSVCRVCVGINVCINRYCCNYVTCSQSDEKSHPVSVTDHRFFKEKYGYNYCISQCEFYHIFAQNLSPLEYILHPKILTSLTGAANQILLKQNRWTNFQQTIMSLT